ncbi:TonB-dependent receptor [Flavobacterium sp. Fl-77]|uniref:TonB-dependent receptor n=1 Tax=Flavobacterium flavipigmentatum TaxID=2893884 RepID=A0AAJ2W1V0_9FLAO|nr:MULTISPECIES: TonB-dependent receptor [unclassified Flavobacterium]MDX6183371.1 TonB-dependent receptor [Flavobacterium sp. Fl-33]MDX6186655.1 TonB-dependent receptor [Flavobacterium sp. Fl-77]UFH38577.1 TonB-dependent receptor [Flavobacterium sp. F-70]
MKTKLLFAIAFLFIGSLIFAQNTISGKVVDEKGKPVPGANIYIDGTYDGATSSETGDFSFETTATGNQFLVVSFLIYDTFRKEIDVTNFKEQTVKLRENVNALDAVVITAGTLESGDKARVSVLKPLDIVTTAGSAGNIIAALQTLPGTQTVGEDGRLFVRGGEASETQTFVDGIRVAQPYGATTNNLPTRGRFSPFLFSGIAFSTGGYSAEYGEALSSVLLLNTQDEPDQNKTEIALMTVGLGLGNTQKWNKSSLSVNTAYINLAPYQAAIPQNVDWNNPYQSLSGETVYRYHFVNGIFKLYAAFDSEKFDLNQQNINFIDPIRTNLNNNNFYLNASYKGTIGTGWQLTTGMSYGYNNGKVKLNSSDINSDENAAQLKIKLRKNVSDHFKLSFGADYFITKFNENFNDNASINVANGYDSNIAAFYTEGDILFSKNFAAKVGFRLSNNSLLDETAIAPRASLAYKVSKSSQFSFAYGDFTQTPVVDYIKYSKFHQFESEKARHYILNYQFTKPGQTFRAEAYFKDYSNLVQYDTRDIQYNSNFNNNGSGYAKGLDLFWRDSNLYKNLEYWISYSYIDSERAYKNFPTMATPGFIANHNLSVVTKYFITDWKSQIGFTNSFSTGRPYNNPNEAQFMNGKTKAYNSLSFNWAYLLTTQKILYFSISNVLGTQNVFGYDYAKTPDATGFYNRQAVVPTADRFFFVGFFWTISQNKNDNQLKNL